MIFPTGPLDPSCGIALGLSAILAVSAGQERLWQPAAVTVPDWVPWLGLAALGVASAVFGILNPDLYAAVGMDGFAGP